MARADPGGAEDGPVNFLLAETPDAVPYPWVVAIVVSLCAVICWEAKLIMELFKREQKRADSLAKIVNSFVVSPGKTCDCEDGETCERCS